MFRFQIQCKIYSHVLTVQIQPYRLPLIVYKYSHDPKNIPDPIVHGIVWKTVA
jgi:hypothetical protein